MARRSFYDILGIAKDATIEAIKRAYRQKVTAYHPDLYPQDTYALQAFLEATAAYEVLRDPVRRTAYDQSGADSQTESAAGTIASSQSTNPVNDGSFTFAVLSDERKGPDDAVRRLMEQIVSGSIEFHEEDTTLERKIDILKSDITRLLQIVANIQTADVIQTKYLDIQFEYLLGSCQAIHASLDKAHL
jgi:DnaJ-class molecular chaperone